MSHAHTKNITLRRAIAAAIAGMGVLALLGSPARAAAPTDAPSASAGDTLQEVVVTANRRTENSQQVPIAISAFSADTVGQLQIADARDLASEVPGLLFDREANSSIPFLRGVGTPVGQSGDEPSVAMYVDDVYIPAGSASLANFNSIERLEVDKGPQGTLFGRNATGGVVQVFTKNPSATPSVDVRIGYANYDTTSSSAYATGPLTRTLAGNVAIYQSNQHDGWGKNLLTGNPAYKEWDDGGRAKLLWAPTDKTSFLLTYDFDETRTETGVDLRPFPNTLAVPGLPGPAGYYDLNDADSRSVTYQQGISLKATSDFDAFRVVSISAWRYTHPYFDFAYDPVPVPIAYANVFFPETTYTEELRLLSPDSSRVRWILGTFYFNDSAGYNPLNLTGLAFEPFPFIDTYGVQKTISWSGFADATYPILKDTDLTAGLRYTADERTLLAKTVLPGAAIPAPNSPQNASWDKLAYRLNLDHHFTADVMAYVAYNRGFKSGVFNTVINPLSPIGPPVQPETLDAYTVGEKAEFFEQHLRVNTEFFYYKDKNIQVQEIKGPATFLSNASSATFKGVDLDVTMLPVERLSIVGSIELLDGRYGSFVDGQYFVYEPTGGNCAFGPVAAPYPPYCGLGVGSPGAPPGFNRTSWNLSGNKTIDSPPFSAAVTINYRIPSRVGEFDPNLSFTHMGDYYANVDNGLGQVAPSSRFNDKQGIINLLNAALAWHSSDEHWSAQLWVKNLTGVKYWSNAQEDAFTTQYSAAVPRRYGVNIATHW